ncbi:MAG TPA: ATP-binding protein [Thermodesulfobacteriota bacterium]|nr:ATP-binding protein [Thermodesulfobacteriota bacterium]
MTWSFRPGIRTQIVFTLTILMAGAVAFVGFLFLKVEERNLMDQKIREGKQIVGALQRFLQDWAPESPGKTLSENLDRVVFLFAQGHPDLHFTVVNRDFNILADSRPDQVGKVLRDMGLEKAMASGKIFAHGAESEESFSLMKRTPLLISSAWLLGDQTVGGIRAEIPLEDLKETLFRSQSILFLYFFLTAFLLIVVGSFLLSRVILKPLKKLMQMSDKIAEGNLELMSGPSGGNEVGRVLASFNHMISRLREDRSKMEEYIASLKKVNRELRLAQEEIIRSEKLASIGRLAAGVAHEVGNPTGAILGYLDLLSKGGLAEAEKAEVLKRAELEAERIRRIVRELLEFSRPSARREEEVEVNTVIDRALSLLSHQKKVWEQIHVIRELQKDLPRWRGNPHHLQQVMINLLLNAADALVANDSGQTGGEKKIRITTQALPPEELGDSLGPAARRKEVSPGADSSLFGIDRDVHPPSLQEVSSILQVDVEDSGPGIPAERLGRIFDPFYSTKPPGEGTGLGLAICLGILESYGGKISVQSESGKGARFTILLPIFE